jgi:undecaprenyl-diphosphatase
VRAHTPIRRFVHSRLDTEVLTGLALTLAVVMLCLAGVLIALLVVLIHHSEPLADLDKGAARWAHHHSGEATRRFLDAVTTLASTRGVIVIAVIVGVVEWIRVPNRWIPVFLLAVTLGDSFVTNTIKGIVDRSRPTIDPLAAHLGPSFPSGHSSTAAALFAALALLAGRRRSPRTRAVLVGVAVGLAVAVACSRVLLDLHWVSDVVAGLALGWAWFALCAIAFGGWALRLGAVVEQASRPRGAKPPQREAGSARS